MRQMINSLHMTRILTLCLGLTFFGAGLGQARAEARFQVLVCYPGGPVKAKTAAPAMDKMLRVLEKLGGWPAGSFSHAFTSKADECRKLLADKKPAFAITSLGLFLEHRESNHLVPLANPRISGRSEDVYRILVKKGGPKDLAGLKGKTLSGTLLGEPKFLRRVIFKGQINPAEHFMLKPSKRALRSLRKLARGKLDAVMVNQLQYSGIKQLPFAADFEVIFTSEAMPLQGLVADSQKTTKADRAKLTNSLVKMCSHADGKQMCELFGIDAFVAVDPKIYDPVEKLWRENK